MRKLKKVMLCALGGIALLSTLTGCANRIVEMPRESIVTELTTAEQKYCRELLICFLKDDAEGFVARLSPESREKFGVKEFQATRKELIRTMGTPISFRYITTLEFVAVQPHIWKVRFEREDRKGEKFRSETLFRVITGRANDGTILVLGFNFL